MLRLLNIITFFFVFNLFATVAFADTSFVNRPDVKTFIQSMVKKHHFKKKSLETLFNQVKIRPKIIQHIKKPLEKEPWHLYQVLFVNESRIKNGVSFWNKHEKALKKAEQLYGVPASIIVATIGIESKYGQRKGNYPVIDALSNLAFSDSKRAPFFRNELEQFLLLTRENHLNPLKVMGSYAGAIGQPQFMPTSYRHFAVNFSKSGKIDLMNNEVDVIGSIANYYQKHGWRPSEPIAIPALRIGDRYDYLMRKNKINQPFYISDIVRLGIIPKYKISKGSDLLKVKVIELQSNYTKEYWLGFNNFIVIKRYNSSDLYAMAVYQLSHYIAALRDQSNHGKHTT